MKQKILAGMAMVMFALPAMAQTLTFPPRTAAGRAVDSVAQDASDANQRAGDPMNLQGKPDGTPGNPPGTAIGRAFDRAAGTDTSGAYPSQSDGTLNNPSGTAVERAVR